MSIMATATGGGIVRKITVENPTTSAVDIAVRRLTSAGTVGASVDELNWVDGPAPNCQVFQAHSSTGPTITAGFIDRYQFPASMAGATVVWTYEGSGLQILKGTANGIAIIPAAGTGQLVVVTFQWEES
jgi:hypothetical protein